MKINGVYNDRSAKESSSAVLKWYTTIYLVSVRSSNFGVVESIN